MSYQHINLYIKMEIKTTNNFEKILKKLNKNQVIGIENAIRQIAENPGIGESKIGDLNNIKVFKFKINSQLYLLSYMICNDKIILLLSVGSHQNFYEDLKRLLKSIKSSNFLNI